MSVKGGLVSVKIDCSLALTWETRELHPRAEAPGFACVLPNPLRSGKLLPFRKWRSEDDVPKMAFRG